MPDGSSARPSGRWGSANGGLISPKPWPRRDPLLRLDLANLQPDKVGLAWDMAWVLWSILDARYGPDWYPKWLSHVHRTFNDPRRLLSMDEYIRTVSETVGEDTAALFERFGTTVGPAGRTAPASDRPPKMSRGSFSGKASPTAASPGGIDALLKPSIRR